VAFPALIERIEQGTSIGSLWSLSVGEGPSMQEMVYDNLDICLFLIMSWPLPYQKTLMPVQSDEDAP
jgi:hypothetical protein